MTEHADREPRDILIQRVVDGEASAEDWSVLASHAREDESIFQDISTRQSQRDALAGAVEDAIAIADHVDLPAALASERTRPVARLAGIGAGWAAAAGIALAWIAMQTSTPMQGDPMPPPSADAAFDQYLRLATDEGVLVERADPVVIEATATDDGTGVDVTYLRQVIERRRFDRVEQVERTEGGAFFTKDVPVSNFVRTRATF